MLIARLGGSHSSYPFLKTAQKTSIGTQYSTPKIWFSTILSSKTCQTLQNSEIYRGSLQNKLKGTTGKKTDWKHSSPARKLFGSFEKWRLESENWIVHNFRLNSQPLVIIFHRLWSLVTLSLVCEWRVTLAHITFSACANLTPLSPQTRIKKLSRMNNKSY